MPKWPLLKKKNLQHIKRITSVMYFIKTTQIQGGISLYEPALKGFLAFHGHRQGSTFPARPVASQSQP